VTDNNTIVLDLSGDKFLAMFLEDLPQKVLDRVVKTAFKAPAKRIAKTAQQLAPKKTGFLKKMIKVRPLRKQKGVVGVRVGTAEKEYTGKAFYAYFQEYGWRQGKRPFRTRVPEHMRAERLAETERLLANSGEISVFDPGLSAARRKRLQAAALTKRQGKTTKLETKAADLRKALGDTRKQIPPKFYFRRAFDAHKNITKKEMRDELILAVEAETEKAAKKMEREAKAAA
jgi:HK97 gp10 family phage protein